jgi:hypothetical protein
MNFITDNSRFTRLTTAIESGWEIEEPVLIRSTWNKDNEDIGGVYHFIMRHKAEDKTNLLSLPPSAQLLQFLATRRIPVTGI